MRKDDYDFRPAVLSRLAPGDVLRSKAGHSYRTVVSVCDDDVIVRSPKGAVGGIPASAVEEFWVLAVPKLGALADARVESLAAGDVLCSKGSRAMRTVEAVTPREVIVRGPSGRLFAISHESVERAWRVVLPSGTPT